MNLNNIFLTGFMSSGKSSFGKKLAKSLDINFIDLDSEIERQENQSINEIFKIKGEKYFRDLETIFLKNLKLTNSVISLGGGTVCFNDNLKILKLKGKVYYLEVPIHILLGRLRKNKTKRPLIKDLSEKEFVSFITKLFNERESFYKNSDLIIDTKNTFGKQKNTIIEFLNS